MGRLVVALAAKSIELSVEELSSIVGLAPDRSGRIGERRPGSAVAARHSSWVIEAFPQQGVHLGEVIGDLLGRLAPFTAGLLELSQRASLVLSVYGTFDFDEGDNFNLSLSTDHLRFLLAIGAEFDISVNASSTESQSDVARE